MQDYLGISLRPKPLHGIYNFHPHSTVENLVPELYLL